MKKSMLIIMDGWGHGQKPPSDAIYQASTPFVKGLYQRFPHTELTTFGEAVGLPDDQMGNSEVGHLNLGAGRIVYQELLRINRAIEQEELAKNQVLLDAFGLARQSGKKLHFIGLVSDGGVHSQTRHLEALCKLAAAQGLPRDQVLIHAFTDGRDTDPRSGAGYLETLLKNLAPTTSCIQDDDLDAGGVSTEELAKLMAGPQKEQVRTWLASLPAEFRVVFVLRAVTGFTSPEVADLLSAQGQPGAAGWSAAEVREVFRQALCSLASQVIHATSVR